MLIFDRGEIPNLDRVPIWEWMESTRKREEPPVASFYFPDTLAGPDILFSLEPKKSVESKESSFGGRILCTLQVSLGLSKEANGLLTFLRLKS